MARVLMAVHAHPDDECFGTGGVLAKCSDAGVRTVLVCCTRGECGEISEPHLATRENIADVRTHELEAAVAVLGVSRLAFLGYRDSGMAGTSENEHAESFHRADIDEATGRLVALVRAERPEVMISYDDKGTYGHPDHIKAHLITVKAFHAASDETQYFEAGPAWSPSKLYYTVITVGGLERFAKAFDEAGIPRPFETDDPASPRMRLRDMATPDELVSTHVDVLAYVDRKLDALLLHKTQMGPESLFRKLPRETSRAMMATETFVLAAAPPGTPPDVRETDLFEGL